MKRLRLWNTLGKEDTDIHPSAADGVLRIYHCGPTVYASPHIGNLRRFLVADLRVRTLRFLGYEVRSVMNITDVGHLLDLPAPASPEAMEAGAAEPVDRMILASEREHASRHQIAAKYTQEFFDALTAIRAEPAQYYPRATMHIPQMIDLTKRLRDKGYAYETSSGVYFDVTKTPAYGGLSGNTLAAVETGARVDAREEKRHPADFALWIKAAKEHLMQWDSPWGRGYPGWHIECSAMAMHSLGETIDIHTGGEDNIFPHHENEIAQSEGATGKPFAHIWLHNAHLLVGDKKMSKSEGTFITLPDLVDHGYDPLAFRLLVLQTHYRSKLNFTWDGLDAATEALENLRAFVRGVWRNVERERPSEKSSVGSPAWDFEHTEKEFSDALANDLGSPQALAVVFHVVRAFNPVVNDDTLAQSMARRILELFRTFDRVLALIDIEAARELPEIPEHVQRLVQQREKARVQKEFLEADRLRVKIRDLGFDVEDRASGPRVTPRGKKHDILL
jgi:cysteinyl-tRNA synthetase